MYACVCVCMCIYTLLQLPNIRFEFHTTPHHNISGHVALGL